MSKLKLKGTGRAEISVEQTEYRQGQIFGGGGVCFSLCTIWILRHHLFRESVENRLRALGQGSTSAHKPAVVQCVERLQMGYARTLEKSQATRTREFDTAVAAARQAGQDVNFFALKRKKDEAGSEDFRQAIITRLDPVGLAVDGRLESYYGSESTVAKVLPVANRVHKYTMIGFDNGFGAGHAICAYKSGGKMGFFTHLYVFDPNMGEFKVPGDAASQEIFFNSISKAYEGEQLVWRGLHVANVTFTARGYINPWF